MARTRRAEDDVRHAACAAADDGPYCADLCLVKRLVEESAAGAGLATVCEVSSQVVRLRKEKRRRELAAQLGALVEATQRRAVELEVDLWRGRRLSVRGQRPR